MIELLKKQKDITEYIETKNYYYEYHMCGNHNKKVMLDYTLSYYVTDEIIKFGICDVCNKCFYKKDYKSKEYF
ncbi:MAG: hypothetical protein IJS61_11345 [Firmicutes bacterium]|nr:hypothetical protein [Bacillota bacterium]